jgi:hypothetical protein
MLSHNSTSNYYYLNFNLAQHHGYDIHTLENLMPYEHDIYVTLLLKYLENEREKQKRAEQ